MKNNKVCSKCGNADILLIPGSSGAYGMGNNIQVGWTNLSAVLVDRYVCCTCGFSEEWIDKAYFDKLKEKFGE